MGVEALGRAIDELAAMDPHALGDEETVVELHRLCARLEAIKAGADAAYDASKDWMVHRSRSAAEWLAYKTREPIPSCQRSVRLGRALRHMPAAEAAWRAGEITSAHVNALDKAWTPGVAELFERDEKLLVDDARELRFSSFNRAVTYWVAHADPDRGEEDALKQREGRKLHFSQSFGGMWFGELTSDPIHGLIISSELKRLAEQEFHNDWAEARARLGREPNLHELRRTSAQRMHDALAEMAIRSRTAPADGKRPEPLFSVLVGYETLHGPVCELSNRSILTPAALLPWIDQAWVERVVFDSESRVIDASVRQRFFTGATRRAVEVRDQECFHPTCEAPAEDCEIDHIEPASWGGLTTTTNGRCACGFHNRDRQRRTEPPLD